MITIIADEGEGKIGEELSRELSAKGINVEYISLEGVSVKPCTSCCMCTDKTYGRCVTRDDADWILPKVIRADVLLFVTPITFGSYSSKIKRVMDKFPLIMDRHYFMENGELVKGGMLGRRFKFYAIGIRENCMDAEIEAFRQLHHENLIITRGFGNAFIVDTVPTVEMQSNIMREVLSI